MLASCNIKNDKSEIIYLKFSDFNSENSTSKSVQSDSDRE